LFFISTTAGVWVKNPLAQDQKKGGIYLFSTY
jgi:hypothetical protein